MLEKTAGMLRILVGKRDGNERKEMFDMWEWDI